MKFKNNFTPNLIIDKIANVDKKLLDKYKIKALILDVDNTLTSHGSQDIKKDVLDWLNAMKELGIPLVIASNNKYERVKTFAEKIELDFVHMSLKPFKKGLSIAINKLKFNTSEIAIIGDQIYTDILGGNNLNLFTILVTEITPESSFFFKLKRFMEKKHIKKYYEKGK